MVGIHYNEACAFGSLVACILIAFMQDAMMSITIRISSFLGRQERQGMLQNAALSCVQCQLVGDCMVIKGCQEQVDKVRARVDHHALFPSEWPVIASLGVC